MTSFLLSSLISTLTFFFDGFDSNYHPILVLSLNPHPQEKIARLGIINHEAPVKNTLLHNLLVERFAHLHLFAEESLEQLLQTLVDCNVRPGVVDSSVLGENIRPNFLDTGGGPIEWFSVSRRSVCNERSQSQAGLISVRDSCRSWQQQLFVGYY